MRVFQSIKGLQSFLDDIRKQNKTIGFVPTMGTLHQGHLSLVEESLKGADVTVCSIFVNPIQFNNKEDLDKYPRFIEKDTKMLEEIGCHVLFNPSVDEMYPEEVSTRYDFGELETVMEGAFRPGHFNGVAVVVKRLFDIVDPDYAYFGEKDFQQLAIIRKLVDIHKLPIKIIGCDIIREEDGLAMSSRNLRLTEAQRQHSTFIYKELMKAKSMAINGESPDVIRSSIKKDFEENTNFKLEYFEISEALTLLPIESFQGSSSARAFIAAFLGEIRLIDNIEINS